MINCGCGKEIHPERHALGYKVCLDCGDKHAIKNKKFLTKEEENKLAVRSGVQDARDKDLTERESAIRQREEKLRNALA